MCALNMRQFFEVGLIRSYEDEGTSYRERFVPPWLTAVGLSLGEGGLGKQSPLGELGGRCLALVVSSGFR